MTLWQAIGGAAALYLALLARSAWSQGELRQFLLSLLIVLALFAAIAGIVWLAAAPQI